MASKSSIPAWVTQWKHLLITLCFATLALVAAIFVPDERFDKLGTLIERMAQDPAGAAVIVSVIAGAITTLRGAWVRQPPPTAVLLIALALPVLTSCGGAQLSAEQRTALAIETQLCITNERAIVERQGTTEEQDRADLAAERDRCDEARQRITGGTTP